MIRFLLISIFLITILTACMPLYCQDSGNLMTFDGNVVSVDPQNSKIVVQTSETFTFSVSSDAKIINEDGFDVKLSDVNPGNYVTLDYYDDNAGNHIATHIEVAYKAASEKAY